MSNVDFSSFWALKARGQAAEFEPKELANRWDAAKKGLIACDQLMTLADSSTLKPITTEALCIRAWAATKLLLRETVVSSKLQL